MIPESEDRYSLFRETTPERLIAHLLNGLEEIYQSSFERTSVFPEPYQRYICPHYRRVEAEMVFLTAARAASVTSRVSTNSSNDAHAVVLYGRFVVTLSKTDGPLVPPRPAEFRKLYATRAELAQIPLGLEGHSYEAPIGMSDEDGPPIYTILTHGPDSKDFRSLGFLQANFVSASGIRFVGSGIDLKALYGRGPSEGNQLGGPTQPPPIVPRS